MKNTVLSLILFLLCAIIFSGCMLWDVEELREKSRPIPFLAPFGEYTVTFESNGGSAIAKQNVASGGTAIRPENPTKSGYVFGGWYKDAGFTAFYNFSEAVTFNITLYAKWLVSSIKSEIGIELAAIPGGTFTMGPTSFDVSTVSVTLSKGFYMGKYQITQEQYQEVMGTNPSYFHGGTGREPAAGELQGKRPVEQVTWFDAIDFCNKLSEMEDLTPVYTITDAAVTANWSNNGYRLPTEAEWEYACRAGSNTAWYFGDTEADLVNYAWYYENASYMTHPVGKKTANAWGLHDMHGNVWEWCWDWYGSYASGAQTDPRGVASGPERVIRGGNWYSLAQNLRSAYRSSSSPDWGGDIVGFRVVLPDDGNTHTHTYSTTWSFNTAQHWKECTSCDAKTEPVNHAPADGVCTTCGYYISTTGMEMMQIPAGTFTMGTVSGGYDDERPVRQVTLSAFKMGKYEVTQEQYLAVMGENPSIFSSDPAAGETQSKRPVECVSWYAAIEFCNMLSMKEGLTPAYRLYNSTNPADWGTVLEYNDVMDAFTIVTGSTGYRLPTEAQWEYACRAGTTTDWYFGNNNSSLGNHAWYSGNSDQRTHEVGKKLPNAYGLYDMYGNVEEWCWDRMGTYESGNTNNPMGPGPASGYYRVLRGGSYTYSDFNTRSAYRFNYPHNDSYFDKGFRVVLPSDDAHDYVYTVTGTLYPAQSIQTCSVCGETTGTARNTEIGDTGPAGGIIFYVDPSGFSVLGYTGTTGTFAEYTAYYLEAAPANEGSSIQWGAYGTLITDVTTFTSTSDSKASLIGNGRKDTQIIVNHLSATEETGRAAQLCASKTVTVGGTVFNDWFLPSLGELNEMYKARNHLGIPDNFVNYFWSSSQVSSNYAWGQNFGDYYQDIMYKNFNYYVRIIRAF